MRTGLAAVGIGLLLAAGCAGDEENGQAADELRAEANAVCADFEQTIAGIPPPLEDDDEWGAIAADIGDHLETGINELAALEPPESLRGRYEEWIELKRDALAATRDLQEAGAAHDVERIRAALDEIAAAEAEADPLAEELGLTECAAAAG